jgi:hypothetical protein
LAWTCAPGAWPAIITGARSDSQTTGRGAWRVAVALNRSAQSRQARASAESRSRLSAARSMARG